MPALGKEIERQLTSDEIALSEVQGYIDKVERQVETQQTQLSKPQQAQPDTAVSQPTLSPQGMAGMATAISKPKIVLPVSQAEVESGLGKSVAESVRWLSEWCVMMIKKYPGRVFYMPQGSNK